MTNTNATTTDASTDATRSADAATTAAGSALPRDSDPRPILVIGASGKTGRPIVRGLERLAVPVRSASRSASTRFDWADESTWAPALEDARAAYVVPSDEPVAVDRFLALAEAAGLDRLVALSARMPSQGGDGVIPAFEAAVLGGAIPATVVQPAWFSQNFTEGMFVDELAGGVLRLPVGDGREPFVDTADIAAVVVAALTEDGHAGRTYELSGPELLTFDDAVTRLGRITGRDLRFEPVEPGAWADAVAPFLPVPIIDLLLNLFAGIRDGDNAHLSTGVEGALGRRPRTFDDALTASTAPAAP